MYKNVISVIDGLAGSCGKAKVIGEIATDKSINLGASITNCMPNAGHTFVDEKGNATIFRNISVSIVNPNTELFIGPGSAIDMDVFIEEYERVSKYLGDRKIYVHELVPLIEERHKEYEREHIRSGSTFKGCGAVSAEKVMRDKNLKFFKGYKNAIVCSNDEWINKLYEHVDKQDEYVMLEGSQGCDLDINHSSNYPNTTSRNVSTMQILADSGIAANHCLQTIMVIRPFPIRISNSTELGITINSGSYGTARELTWSEVNISSLLGYYPTIGLLNDYKKEYSVDAIKKFYKSCPDIYLEQIFKDNYKNVRLDSITLEEALELERLSYKSKGVDYYESEFIELPLFTYPILENDGNIIDQSEQTTVTKRERRVFDLDIKKLKTNILINKPACLYLNFFQHIDYDCYERKCDFDRYDIGRAPEEYLAWLESESGVDIAALGTGARNGERILIKKLVNPIEKC